PRPPPRSPPDPNLTPQPGSAAQEGPPKKRGVRVQLPQRPRKPNNERNPWRTNTPDHTPKCCKPPSTSWWTPWRKWEPPPSPTPAPAGDGKSTSTQQATGKNPPSPHRTGSACTWSKPTKSSKTGDGTSPKTLFGPTTGTEDGHTTPCPPGTPGRPPSKKTDPPLLSPGP